MLTIKCTSVLAILLVISVINKCSAFDTTGYKYPGILVGEARGDLRELPARLDVGDDGQSFWYGRYVSPCCRRWEADGWVKLNDRQATETRPLLDCTYRNGGKPLAGVWALQQEEGTLLSPTLYSRFSEIDDDSVSDRVCMKILAKVPEGSRISVIAETIDQSGAMEIGEITGTSRYEWALTRLVKVKSPVTHGHDVRIKLLGKQPKDAVNKALIQWTTFCADEPELRDYYSTTYLKKNSTQAHYSLLVPQGKYGTVQSKVCLNGGRLDLDTGVCQCAPGFAGAVCETSCGPNSYGVYCTARCSTPQSRERECRGILSCSDRGCKCFTGLRGDTCDEPCPPGNYGSDCDFKCGACASDVECDRYTGRCPKGCSGGQQSPFCQEECGRSFDKSIKAVELADYFWNVGIYEKINRIYTKVCSASLVRPGYLLTAAWCFFSEEDVALKPASDFVAVFGTDRVHCFSEDTFPADIETRHILGIKVPPLYRGSRNLHVDDIALVQLEREVVPGPGIAPLCYEPSKTESFKLPNDALGFVAGWNNHGNHCNTTLKGYYAEYMRHTSCLSESKGPAINTTDTTKFCARTTLGNGGETEKLHSGAEYVGSGFIYNSHDDWYIYGVKSGANANISIYTKVSDYIEWITSTWNRLDIKQAVKENTVNTNYDHQEGEDPCSSK